MTNRARVGGYYWRQYLASIDRAESAARQRIADIRRLTNNGTITTHLLDIALALSEIQTAAGSLKEISNGDE